MSSHYIPVGKLKIDKELLDIACPAAGYGTTPPDPAVYCPANGYSQPAEIWAPPVEIPNPGTDQILLLCDDLEQGVASLYCKANSGNVLAEILSIDMVVLWSNTNGQSHYISFPTINTGELYVIRLRPETPGSYITHFYKATYNGYVTDYRILQAKLNTPQITTLYMAFDGIVSIKHCHFYSNMNSLTTMEFCFRGTEIESVVYPEEMNSLRTVKGLYWKTTNLKICDLRSNFPASAIEDMSYFISESAVEELHFPASLPNVTTIDTVASTCRSLKKVTMFTSAPLLSDIDSAFKFCVNLKVHIKFPPLPDLLSAAYVAQYSSILKLEFEGPSDSCTNMRDLVSNSNVEELILPSSLNSVTNVGVYMMWYNAFKMKRIQLPIAMPLLTPDPGNFINTTTINLLTEITECENWGTGSFNVRFYSAQLTSLYQPSLKVSFLWIGQSTSRSKCSSIEVDWANSVFNTGNAIYIYSSTMDATEMDRIFTALPVVSGSTIFMFGPGRATADISIAEAKGWNVGGGL